MDILSSEGVLTTRSPARGGVYWRRAVGRALSQPRSLAPCVDTACTAKHLARTKISNRTCKVGRCRAGGATGVEDDWSRPTDGQGLTSMGYGVPVGISEAVVRGAGFDACSARHFRNGERRNRSGSGTDLREPELATFGCWGTGSHRNRARKRSGERFSAFGSGSVRKSTDSYGNERERCAPRTVAKEVESRYVHTTSQRDMVEMNLWNPPVPRRTVGTGCRHATGRVSRAWVRSWVSTRAVTVSIGIAEFRSEPPSGSRSAGDADRALSRPRRGPDQWPDGKEENRLQGPRTVSGPSSPTLGSDSRPAMPAASACRSNGASQRRKSV